METTIGQPHSKEIDCNKAAELLGITPNNLRQYTFRGVLKPVGRQGRRNLFSWEDVERLAAMRGKSLQ